MIDVYFFYLTYVHEVPEWLSQCPDVPITPLQGKSRDFRLYRRRGVNHPVAGVGICSDVRSHEKMIFPPKMEQFI